MSAAFWSLLESSPNGLIWIAAYLVGRSAIFLLYIGISLGVALFHPDEKVRKHAEKVLLRLLDVFKGRKIR